MSASPGPRHVAFLLKDLKGGGVQNMTVVIANAFAARGHRTSLLVCRPDGPVRERISDGVELVPIPRGPRWRARLRALLADPGGIRPMWRPILTTRETSGTLRHLPGLIDWLAKARPDQLYAATPFMNAEAALACHAAGDHTRLVVSEHNDLSHGHPFGSGWRAKYLPPLLAHYYRWACAVVAVSDGVADDVVRRTGLPKDRITVIYNAVVTDDLTRKAAEPLDHPWFRPDQPPVILGVGRLGRAKDFPTLIRALARVREKLPARLLILGEAANPRRSAKRKAELDAVALEVGVQDHVRLEGYVANPFPYMRLASVFALSSLYEGFGNVLVESMACGCAVVSTDCPSGPAEILEHGRYGPLVQVGDHKALGDAILSVLDAPPDPELLRKRAADFTVDRAVDQYEALLECPAWPAQPMVA